MINKQPYQTLPSDTESYSFFFKILGRKSPSPTPVRDIKQEESYHASTEASEIKSLPVFVELPSHELTEFSSNFKISKENDSTEPFKKILLEARYPFTKDSSITFHFPDGMQSSTTEKETQQLSIVYSSDGSILLEKLTDEGLKRSLASIKEIQPGLGKDLAKKLAQNLMSEINVILLESVSDKLSTLQNLKPR